MRVITSLILLTACVAFAGVAFGVNPIGPMPESYIGYKIGPVVPYLSLNFLNASGHDYYHYRYHEDDNGIIDDYERFDTLDWSVSILAPTFGSKLLFGATELKPFVRLSVGVPLLLSLKVETNDTLDQEDIDEQLEGLRNNTKALIITGGAGVEYYLSERFSIGGEFIYRYFSGATAWEEYDEFEDPDYDYTEWRRWEYDYGFGLSATSAGLWLNYYF